MKTETKIYLEAARLVAEGEKEFSCITVFDVARGEGLPAADALVREYAMLFAEGEIHETGDPVFGIMHTKQMYPDGTHGDWYGPANFAYAQNLRVLCLCMMAAIVGEEDA